MARLLFTGKSGGTYDLNSGLTNRDHLAKTLSVSKSIFMKQVHGNSVQVINSDSESLIEADGLVTTLKSTALIVQSADCLPLLMSGIAADGVEIAIAAVHVGRKGLVNGVAINAVTAMQALGAVKITGVVGPHICHKCYEVDDQIFNEVTALHPRSRSDDRRLNLFAGLAAQIPQVTLRNLNICTLENPRYFSYRRGAESGRQVGVICL